MDIHHLNYRQINRILFVCMGNICRSPTAEAVFRGRAKKLGLSLQFDSAGTIAHHQGEQPDQRSAQAGRNRGYDFSGITARKVTLADFEQFDLILAADKQNFTDLQQMATTDTQRQKLAMMLQWGDLPYSEVPDPYYGGSKGFELVLDLLEESAQQLLRNIATAKR
ncbi:low molecular weight protein-tyrosine-phosphatase [uncultured Ferrimonas sp.]|uniref:low molecular weight protein-tyrosine-phosphatase n=1 Tax=uncultured Ferrimonas sp. TaxID=432640 RepID=UPI002610BA2A|nr:low molecular weight protein-tyrosine-phosphatase [uncultured Ferrimonas sp.]